MPSSNDYTQLLPEIAAVKSEEIKKPNIPFDIFLQESENLFQWCKDDKEMLAKCGLDVSLIDKLPLLSGACREAQARWVKENKTKKAAEISWRKEYPAALNLRNELIHDFRFAFRKNPGLLEKIANIEKGNSYADFVQDLNDLSVLGIAHLALVTKTGRTRESLENAALLASRIAELLATVNSEKQINAGFLEIRNKAYTLLKNAVDEIRECGRFVFWRNPERLKGYSSAYWQAHNAKRPAEKPAGTPTN